MSRWKTAAGSAALCLLAAGCGGGGSPISTGAGNTLRADVLALTQAAAAHQWSAADQDLAQVRGDLTTALSAGDVDASQAQVIRADVDAIAADLAARRQAAAPTTPTSTTPQPPTHKPAPKPQPRPKPHPPHGHGHGHGHGGDEGGD